MVVSIAYYITGHGLGHATRSLLILECLLSRGLHVHIISTIKSTFFEFHLASLGSFTAHERCLDSGAIQEHSLKVDAVTTLRKYLNEVHGRRDVMVAQEAEFLTTNAVDFVFVDATPIACAAAKLAGCKSLLITNFTWDFIYREMLGYEDSSEFSADEKAQLQQMVEDCSADYNHADAYVQLPGKCALPNHFTGDKLIDTAPLVARRAKLSSSEVRRAYGVPDAATKVLLVGFGGHDTNWTLKDSSLPDGWVAWVLGAKESDLPATGKFSAIPFECYVPDLIAAADVVLGKLGYGTVSECLTHHTPLVYVPRSNWPEEAPLREYLQSREGGLVMPVDAFVAGDWGAYLHAALTLPANAIGHQEEANDPVGRMLSDPKLMALMGPKFATFVA